MAAKVLLGGMAAALVACVLLAPGSSKDVNSYAFYGQMAQHRESPYTHVPRDFTGDPLYPGVSYFWNDSPSVYGPAFTAVSSLVMQVAGDSYTAARLGFQLIEACALAAATALIYARTRRKEMIVLVGLNPLLLTYGVNDAHCDVLVGLAVLFAATSAADARSWRAGIGLGMAALIKITALPALAGLAVWMLLRRGMGASARAVAAFAAVVIAGLALAGGLQVLQPLHQAANRHTRFSLWNPVHQVLSAWLGTGLPTQGPADAPVAFAANALVALAGIALIYRYRNDVAPFLAVTAGLVAYQLFGAYVLAWYAAWALPTLALEWRSRLAALVMAHASLIAIAYLNGYFALATITALAAWWVHRRANHRHVLPWIEQ